MKLGISQPTFLPWAGYFGLINYTDQFVFLDNVQFDKRSWQQRNNIKLNEKSFLLSVPVISKNKSNQKINEVFIDSKNSFIEEHKKTIEHNYKKSKYFSKYSELIFKVYDMKHEKLIDLNIDLIKLICKILDINFSFTKSSLMNVDHVKENLILEICKLKKCEEYVSTIGSKIYLKNDHKFKENSINLNFFEFKNLVYQQLGGNFLNNLSIIDLIFNLGPNSLKYINKNFYINE
jgi:hypothetical protein